MAKVSELTSSLKVRCRPQHRNRLIHNPLSDTQITLYPSLDVLAIGNLICVETGAVRLGPKDINLPSLPQSSSLRFIKIEDGRGSER
jgi:hypothetical protein